MQRKHNGMATLRYGKQTRNPFLIISAFRQKIFINPGSIAKHFLARIRENILKREEGMKEHLNLARRLADSNMATPVITDFHQGKTTLESYTKNVVS